MKLYLKFHGIRWKTFIAILLPSNDQSKLPRGKAECFHATVMQFFHFFPYLSDFHRPIFPPPSLFLPISLFFHKCTWVFMMRDVLANFRSCRRTVGKSRLKSFKGWIVCLSFTSNPISPLSIVSLVTCRNMLLCLDRLDSKTCIFIRIKIEIGEKRYKFHDELIANY